MRELKFRLWSKIAQRIIPWLDVKKKPHTIFDKINYESMQFTGLIDANGSDIYEGDIIRSIGSNGDEIRHIVSYDNQAACFSSEFIPFNEFNRSCGINQGWINEFEKKVVGNTYES